MATTLDDFAKENAKFLRLADNESFTGKFLSYAITANPFDPEKQVVLYTMELPTGKRITWRNASSFVARAFAKLPEGTEVKITRLGSGMKTRYTIETPKSPGLVEDASSPFKDEVPF